MTDTNIGRQSGAGAEVKTRVREAASSAADTASNLAGQASGFASKAASALASEAQHKATGVMQEQMQAGADYVALVSEKAHSAAAELEDKAPELARMVHDVAARAESFADDLRNRSVDEVFDMAWDYARRNPRLFLGGAIAAGFLLARFAKSSAERSASMSRHHSPSRASTDSEKPIGARSARTSSGGASYAG